MSSRAKLSDIVKDDLERLYPDLFPRFEGTPRPRPRFWVPPRAVITALVVVGATLVLNETAVFILSSLGRPSLTYNLDFQGTTDLLASSLEALAALVGISIPTILFIVEFLQKEAAPVIKQYLEETNIQQTAFWALGALGLNLLVLWLTATKSSLLVWPCARFYLTFLILSLDVAVLVETGKTVWKARQYLSDENHRRGAFVSQLMRSLEASFWAEAKCRLQQRHYRKQLGDLGLQIRHRGTPRYAGTTPIASERSGVILNVDLPRLIEFSQACLSTNPQLGTCVVRSPGDKVQIGDTLAYVATDQVANLGELPRLLNEALIVGPAVQQDDLSQDLLERLDQTAQSAITGGDEVLFHDLRGLYANVFALGQNLPPLPDAPDLEQRPWRAHRLAVFHLRSLVSAAARSADDRFITELAFELRNIAGHMLWRVTSQLHESLEEILGLFTTMYVEAHQHHCTIGADRSVRFLLETSRGSWLLQPPWDSSDDPRGRMVLGTLEHLAKYIIDFQDQSSLETVLSELNSTFGFRPGSLVDVLVFRSASYLLEGYRMSQIEVGEVRAMWDILKTHFPSPDVTLTLYLQLVTTPVEGTDFEHSPSIAVDGASRGRWRYDLFYCVCGIERAIAVQPFTGTPDQDFIGRLPSIERTCSAILEAPDKWQPILGVSSEELSPTVEGFLQMNRRLADESRRRIEDIIIDTDISSEKVAQYRTAFQQGLQLPGLLGILRENGKVMEPEGVSRAQVWQSKHICEKAWFISRGTENTDASARFTQMGATLRGSIEQQIIETWMAKGHSIRTREDWVTLSPYLDAAIDRLSQRGRSANLIVVPSTLEFGRGIDSLANYRSRDASEALAVPYTGYYRGIPILEWWSEDFRTVLVVDLDVSTEIHLAQPDLQVGELSEVERAELLRAHNDWTDRDLQLHVSVEANQKTRVAIPTPDGIIRLALKFPDSYYRSLDDLRTGPK